MKNSEELIKELEEILEGTRMPRDKKDIVNFSFTDGGIPQTHSSFEGGEGYVYFSHDYKITHCYEMGCNIHTSLSYMGNVYSWESILSINNRKIINIPNSTTILFKFFKMSELFRIKYGRRCFIGQLLVEKRINYGKWSGILIREDFKQIPVIIRLTSDYRLDISPKIKQ